MVVPEGTHIDEVETMDELVALIKHVEHPL